MSHWFFPLFSLIAKNYEEASKSLDDLMTKNAKFHLTDAVYYDFSFVKQLSPRIGHVVQQVRE